MRPFALILLALVAAAAALVFALGLDDRLARATITLQRDYQDALAAALRALRGQQPGAVTGFLGICFAYGFLHAVGPGHGKAVIAAYGMASAATLRRMLALAAVSSLAQATVAVVLVYAGIWAFDGARDRIEGLSALVEPLSTIAIGLLGLMLLWRGIRHLGASRGPAPAHHQGHHHHHQHDAECGCGHAHAPSVQAVDAARSLREMAALVAGIALRPCTGALFLLILTWRLDLDGLGVTGAYVMGLGTLVVTALSAALAVALRRGSFHALPRFGATQRLGAGLEIVIGSLIAIIAFSVAVRLLSP